MTTRLILVRHGNTFRPEDEPVWVGSRTNLPLVEKGFAQAKILGEALRDARVNPNVFLAGPLQRTRQTALLIAETLKFPVDKIRTEPRLKEIDYGAWEGKSTAAIIAHGGGDELTAWNKQSIFPVDAAWQPGEGQIISDAAALLAETTEGTSLFVTSNGILRFFARLAVNAAAFPDLKVATGHLCVMDREQDGWRILQWNLPPELLTGQITS